MSSSRIYQHRHLQSDPSIAFCYRRGSKERIFAFNYMDVALKGWLLYFLSHRNKWKLSWKRSKVCAVCVTWKANKEKKERVTAKQRVILQVIQDEIISVLHKKILATQFSIYGTQFTSTQFVFLCFGECSTVERKLFSGTDRSKSTSLVMCGCLSH